MIFFSFFFCSLSSQRTSDIVLLPFLLLNFVFSGHSLQMFLPDLAFYFFMKLSVWFTATLSGICSLIFRCDVLPIVTFKMVVFNHNFILQYISSCTAFSHSLCIWMRLFSFLFYSYTAISSNINAASSIFFDDLLMHAIFNTPCYITHYVI